jgi:hypothetical protein
MASSLSLLIAPHTAPAASAAPHLAQKRLVLFLPGRFGAHLCRDM